MKDFYQTLSSLLRAEGERFGSAQVVMGALTALESMETGNPSPNIYQVTEMLMNGFAGSSPIMAKPLLEEIITSWVLQAAGMEGGYLNRDPVKGLRRLKITVK